MNQNITIAAFIVANGLTMTSKETFAPRPGWSDDSFHFRVTIKRGKARFSTAYSMGNAHKGKLPELDDVLNCLASDASSFENAKDEDDFCSEFGAETVEQFRANRRAYRAIAKQVPKLKALLGEEAYKTVPSILQNLEREKV